MAAVSQMLLLPSSTTLTYDALDPATKSSDGTLSNVNRTWTSSNGNAANARTTIGKSSGHFYVEAKLDNVSGSPSDSTVLGLITSGASMTVQIGVVANGWGYAISGQKQLNTAGSAYGSSYTTNDVIGMAIDFTTGSLSFWKNGVAQGVATTGLAGPLYAAVSVRSSSAWTMRFNPAEWTQSPPGGATGWITP